MSAERQSDELIATDGVDRSSALASRRRMLRRSLGTAVPVVATMASLPVSAGTCVVASSFISAATFASRNPAATSRFACTITSRSALLTNSNLTSFLNSTSFGDVFVTAPTSGLGFALNSKLKDMLALSTVGGEVEVAWRLVWLYMNLRQAAMGDMGTNYAQTVWQNYKSNGNSYLATGIAWNSSQLIAYLTFVLGA